MVTQRMTAGPGPKWIGDARTVARRWFVDAVARKFVFPEFRGIALGRKRVGGEPTDQWAIAVAVTQKLHRKLVDPRALVPDHLSGFSTDVVVFRESRLLAAPRPVAWGTAVANVEYGPAGTLGCVVTRGRRRYLLSNAHVIARPGTAVGDPIVEPWWSEDPDDDAVAYLSRAAPVTTTEDAPLEEHDNRVDAAIARVRTQHSDDCIASELPGDEGPMQTWRETSDIHPGLAVAKYGAKTRRTTGEVAYVAASIVVPFFGGEAMFHDQILTSDIGEPGDSGSLVYCPDDQSAVGLLFAQVAGEGGVWTAVNPIAEVQAALRVKAAPRRWSQV